MADATYTAVYTNAIYTISYLNEDGSTFTNFIDGVFIKRTYDVTENVDLPTAVHMDGVGSRFDGWTNSTGQVYGWLAGAETGDQTFYAKLSPVVPPQTETYDAGSVTNCATEQEANILASLINANRSTMISVPAGIDDTEGAYTGLFYAYVEGTSVVIDFTEVAAAAQAELVTNKVATITLSTLATASEDQSVKFTGLTPGVYYSISEGTSLTGMTEGNRVMANADGEATLTFTTYGGTAGFYKMIASAGDKPAPVPNEDPEQE